MLLKLFQKNLLDHFNLQKENHTILIAVSGGIDSIVLTDLFYRSEFDFVIAHCNFKLRDNESERDEAFVKTLGARYNKIVLTQRFDTKKYAEENGIAIQEAARKLRYNWFKSILEDRHSNRIHTIKQTSSSTTSLLATAHNANDNIETQLMYFFRGTGIQGLTGMPEKDMARKLIRPLLFAKREDIHQHALQHNLNWVEDSSNSSNKYTRNFFRIRLIPAIKEVFPNVEDNLSGNLDRFKEAAQLYHQAIQQHKKTLLTISGNEVHIPLLKLKKTQPLNTIIWEIIKDYTFTAAQLPEVRKLLDAVNGSYINSSTHRIIINRLWLIIAPLQTLQASNIIIESSEKNITFENGSLKFKISNDQQITDAQTVALLDARLVKWPLLLRKWKQGDYFYPLGMSKKKKLSKFFIDQKLSKTEKEKIWVLEIDKKIAWIIGYRIDNRFKITDHTTAVLQSEFRQTQDA